MKAEGRDRRCLFAWLPNRDGGDCIHATAAGPSARPAAAIRPESSASSRRCCSTTPEPCIGRASATRLHSLSAALHGVRASDAPGTCTAYPCRALPESSRFAAGPRVLPAGRGADPRVLTAGHIDASINDQYRSLHGSLRFLHNIVRFPGCGVFDAGHPGCCGTRGQTRWRA